MINKYFLKQKIIKMKSFHHLILPLNLKQTNKKINIIQLVYKHLGKVILSYKDVKAQKEIEKGRITRIFHKIQISIIRIKSLKNSNIKEKVKITLYKYQIIHKYKT